MPNRRPPLIWVFFFQHSTQLLLGPAIDQIFIIKILIHTTFFHREYQLEKELSIPVSKTKKMELAKVSTISNKVKESTNETKFE